MGRDLRQYTRQTQARLLVGFVFILVVVGVGLIYVFYGPQAAWTGLLCLGMGLSPLLLVWMILLIIDRIIRKVDKD